MDMKEEFTKWLISGGTTSASPSYINHAMEVMDSWLDKKLPEHNIGNLYRFNNYDDFCKELERIKSIPSFNDINDKDQNGRTLAALNKYKDFIFFKKRKSWANFKCL